MATTPNQKLEYKPRGGTLGQATSFNASQYSTTGVMYPDDLMGPNNPYGGNYVIFYINVHEDSMLIKQNGDSAYLDRKLDKVPPSERGVVAGTELSTGAVTTVAGLAGIGAANTLDVAGRTAGFFGGTLKDTTKTITNTGIGILAGAATVLAVGGANKQYKQQKKAIALYVPGDLSTRYGMQWQETDLAGSLALGMGAENIGNIVTSLASFNTSEALDTAGETLQTSAGYLAGLALQTPGAGELLQKSSGAARNPKKEQLFKGVDFRTFTFNYQFFPRSKDEAQQVKNIIKEFKLHMHPEFKQNRGQFLFLYPSEFDIYYYNNGVENMNLPRHTSCVLTDMSVLYTPQGQFTSFEDGMPSQINMNLTFRELAILTKENIQDGY